MPFLCQSVATVEELVSLHDVQAYRQTHCQNSRCLFGSASHGALNLERHRSAGGTAAPAGVHLRRAFRRPGFAGSESLGVCWKKPQRGFEEREPSGVGAPLERPAGRSLSMKNADPPSKQAPVSASVALGLLTRLALWASLTASLGAPERQLPG